MERLENADQKDIRFEAVRMPLKSIFNLIFLINSR
jgi:hypothetical protein